MPLSGLGGWLSGFTCASAPCIEEIEATPMHRAPDRAHRLNFNLAMNMALETPFARAMTSVEASLTDENRIGIGIPETELTLSPVASMPHGTTIPLCVSFFRSSFLALARRVAIVPLEQPTSCAASLLV